MQFAVVILAAGGSTRLGQPKQLLPYFGRTLVEHAAQTALASGASQVVIVAGAQIQEIRSVLEGALVEVVHNENWQQGMGSSIRVGVAALSETIESVVIALCDQPKVTPDLLRGLTEKLSESRSPISASSYDGVVGAPCAFSRSMFGALSALAGDSGARDLIRNSRSPVQVVEFVGGAIDVDTREDYLRLSDESSSNPA